MLLVRDPFIASMKNHSRKFSSKDVLVILFLILISFLLLSPYLLNKNVLIWPNSGLGADVELNWPYFIRYRNDILERNITLWDNTIAIGRPVPGYISGLWLYPTTILLAFMPITLALSISSFIHVCLIGIFSYLLILNLFPVERSSALVGALVAMLNPKLISHLAGTHFNIIFGFAWTPLVIFGVWKAIMSRDYIFAMLAGFAFALQLPTHPQIPLVTVYLIIGMLLYRLARILSSNRWQIKYTYTYLVMSAKTICVTFLTAFLIGAVWIVPIMEYFPFTESIDFSSLSQFWHQLPVYMLFSLFGPTDFQFPEWTMYIGIVPLFLAFIALMGKYRRTSILLWSGVIITILIALGDQTPIYSLAKSVLPGIVYFRTRTRLWLFGSFLVALLAALGVDTAISNRNTVLVDRIQKTLRFPIEIYVFVSGIIILFQYVIVKSSAISLIRSSLSLLLLGVGYYVWRHYIDNNNLMIGVIVLAISIDLFPLDSSFMTSINPMDNFLKLDPVSEYISSQEGIYRIYSNSESMSYATSSIKNIGRIDGISNLQLRHSLDLAKIATGCRLDLFTGGFPPCIMGEYENIEVAHKDPNPNILGLLNVRYVVSDKHIDLPHLRLVYSYSGTNVYLNEMNLPRAFLVSGIIHSKSYDESLQLLEKADPQKYAIVEKDVALKNDTPQLEGNVQIVSNFPDEIDIRTQTNREAMLIYSEVWVPGWKATINRKSVPVLRVDAGLIGLVVPPGSSEINIRYDPLGWKAGWSITVVSLILATMTICILAYKKLIQRNRELI
jgi:hypothetical protein